MQKESIDIINIKCHDLRHQIQDYRQQGNLTDKMMHQLEESIHIYDSVVKTGNEALDVILSSFSLRCQNKQVELTTMADGRGLDFVDEIDMYSLFTNMLDNALEYEETIPEESRFISLTVKAFNDFVHIHSENSYLGDKRGKQDELNTSKKDRIYHGFGIKSMKSIVSKYNGQFDVLIADDMFQVDILLPKKGAKHE
jgi:sensor histidine kinase regulating citrate/malate metabolism